MYLKAIELYGFKSFPDKTRIEFEKGMSAVVGPNGSGKSNISDAIRWVLGETSSRQLRSGGKMEDIIFSGNGKRNPMGFASVSLVLDNGDKTFDMDSDRVTVTRKYYRGGDSEYYINGARVRLRDVQELFFDTGLGKNGYSIIGQGRISEIVTSRPEARREIFEEACGIAGFRFRKNEAERRLEGARGNILRLEDILSELTERLGPLKKESEKAAEFLRLSREKKELEISLWIDRVDSSAERIRRAERDLEIFREDYDNVSRKLEEGEKYLEERYLYSNSLLAKSDENSARVRRAEGEIARLNSRGARADSRRTYALTRLTELREERRLISGEGKDEEEKKQRAKKRIDELCLLEDENKKEENLLARQLGDLTRQAERQGDERGKLAGERDSVLLKIQSIKIDSASLTRRLEAAENRARESEESLKRYSSDTDALKGQKEELEDYIRTAEENIRRETNIRNVLLMKRDSAAEKLEKAENALRRREAAGRQTADRLKLLREMEESLEGFAKSVKTVLSRAKDGKLGGILGSVASIITVEKGYETAVEVALGYALQNIVTRDETSAKRAIDYLKRTGSGRATFLPLDTVRPAKFSEKLPPYARTADTAVKADEKYKNIISNLLGRTILVEDINTAASLAKSLSYRYRVVTVDGQVVNAGGSFTGGSLSRSAGLFTRKSEIISLENRLTAAREEYKKLEEERDKAKTALRVLERQASGRQEDINSLVADKAGADIELARIRQNLESVKNARQIARQGAKKRLLEAENAKSRIEEGKKEEEKLLQKSRSLTRALEKLGEEDRRSEQSIKAVTEKIQRLRLSRAKLSGDLALRQSSMRRLEAGSLDRQARLDKNRRDSRRLKEEAEKRREEKERGERDIARLREKIDKLEAENRDFVRQRLEVEAERTGISAENKALARQKEELSGRAAKLEERVNSLKASYEDVTARLWREHELTVDTARPLRKPVENRGEFERRLSSLRGSIRRLGNVNPGAVEEYKEVSERHSLLSGQLEDLVKSREQLEKLIASLSAEMRQLFRKGFTRINDSFGRIFTRLFGGGTARLEMTGEEDPLTAGIEIKVNPPGKVIKSLAALSGGEQALVAIAIYLAILDYNPSPFCVLDEIEAALDDVNVVRYAEYLHKASDKTQFIVITHRRGTMEEADTLYGVTMQEDGISKLLKLDSARGAASVLN